MRKVAALALATAAWACSDDAVDTPTGGVQAAGGAGVAGAVSGGAAPAGEGAADAGPGVGLVGVAGASGVGAAGAPGGAGGGGAGDASVGPITCNPGCTPIYAYPIDAERACVLARPGATPPPEWAVACECGGAGQMGPACLSRRADGSAWVFVGAAIADDDAWQPCSAEQEAAAARPCTFLHCERPPQSLCSVEDTCRLRGCGGFEYDADGCLRPPCESDDDCNAGESCVTACSEDALCHAIIGNCQCASLPSGQSCRMASTCNPVGGP